MSTDQEDVSRKQDEACAAADSTGEEDGLDRIGSDRRSADRLRRPSRCLVEHQATGRPVSSK
jgi:hypothetical protein